MTNEASAAAGPRGLGPPRPTYRLTRSLLLRGMGLAYFAAFASLAAQLDGLIGAHGILPASDFLERAGALLGPGPTKYWQVPTLFWASASDAALHAVCWSGVALSVLVMAGAFVGWCLALLWVFYLSLVVVGQVFLGYQWDALLLEAGLPACFLASWGAWMGRSRDLPMPFAVWLFRWLAFRLMFQSGVVKLTSGDPTWKHWTALDFHYFTQPLPTWTSWYVHQMPEWFAVLSMAFMFYAELAAPFLMFGPRWARRAALVSLVLLQALIAVTGNYGFFNGLAIVLCIAIGDDEDWRALGRALTSRFGRGAFASAVDQRPAPAYSSWPAPRRIAVGAVGGVLVAVTAGQTLETVAPALSMPAPLAIIEHWLAPFECANRYGLFRVMTTQRDEITIEGSDDGSTWKAYRFRWKPGELDRRPRFTWGHLPRLDWQMWFAALAGDCRAAPWFLRFEMRLLEGRPEVLALLRENPFPDRPPRYLRARLARYTFAPRGSKDWWESTERGLFCPEVENPGGGMEMGLGLNPSNADGKTPWARARRL